MSEAKRQHLARRSMQELAMLAVEVLFTTRLIRVDSWHRYVELEDFQDVLRLLLTKNQGFILLTGHFGNWEIGGYVLATLGFETTTIARPLDNPYINNWVLGVRERPRTRKSWPRKELPTKSPPFSNPAEPLQSWPIRMPATKASSSISSAEKPAPINPSASWPWNFACRWLIGYTRRLDDRFHFRIGVQDIIWPKDWESEGDPLRYITQPLHPRHRGFRPQRSCPIPLGPSPLEKPSQRRNPRAIRLNFQQLPDISNSTCGHVNRSTTSFNPPAINRVRNCRSSITRLIASANAAGDRGRTSNPLISGAHHIANSRHRGRHHRYSRRHRFDQHNAKSLRIRRQCQEPDLI